jgi:uncharacterized DUF497 family protein
MDFEFSEEKNQELIRRRGISFDEIILSIKDGSLIQIYDHPNQGRYKGQSKMEVLVRDYVYCVPCLIKQDSIFLKTAYPDRKATKRHIKNEI